MDFSGSEAEYKKEKKVWGCTWGGISRICEWNPFPEASCQRIKEKQKIGSETRHIASIGDINKLIKNLDYSTTSEDSIQDNKCKDIFAFFLLRSVFLVWNVDILVCFSGDSIIFIFGLC